MIVVVDGAGDDGSDIVGEDEGIVDENEGLFDDDGDGVKLLYFGTNGLEGVADAKSKQSAMMAMARKLMATADTFELEVAHPWRLGIAHNVSVEVFFY